VRNIYKRAAAAAAAAADEDEEDEFFLLMAWMKWRVLTAILSVGIILRKFFQLHLSAIYLSTVKLLLF
jgi:hypothetical protein